MASQVTESKQSDGQPRELAGDKAQRIVEAMRLSVGERGAAASTFDHVAREANVSRGLLHYYFGTKEQLLVEVVRRETEARLAGLESALADAHSQAEIVAVLLASLQDAIENDPGYYTLVFELFTAARHQPEIQRELGELFGRTRVHLAEVLAAKQRAGDVQLDDDPEAVAAVLFALGDGVALQSLTQPQRDHGPTTAAGVRAARRMLGES